MFRREKGQVLLHRDLWPSSWTIKYKLPVKSDPLASQSFPHSRLGLGVQKGVGWPEKKIPKQFQIRTDVHVHSLPRELVIFFFLEYTLVIRAK